MYEYLKGRVVRKRPTDLVLDVGGVGYRMDIPLTSHGVFPEEGSDAMALTYFHVSENAHRLYGFATERERSLFLQLVESVGQIGPRKALAILSGTSLDELCDAIERGDVDRLKRIKGIGEKLAQRLVLELKGHLPSLEVASPEGSDASLKRDVLQALVSLGYERKPAEGLVEQAIRSAAAPKTVEDLLRTCLRGR